MPLSRQPDAMYRHAPRSMGRESTFWRTLGLSAPLSLVALWLALSPASVRAADEPVDVPITRGTIDLSGLKPALGLPSPAGATPAASVPPGAAPTPTRPKPRTVADYVAEAKAKAAADAAAKAAGTPPQPGLATAAVAVPSAPAPAAVAVPASPTATPAPTHGHSAPPPEAATEKAAEKAPLKTPSKPPAPVPNKAAPKPRDEGLDKVAVKLVEAMARAAAKQDKREAAQPKPKAPLGSKEDIKARAAAGAGHAPNGHDSAAAGHGDSHGGAHWAYEGPGGPDNWANLKPDFNTCAVGQRQSPIAIDNSATLQGPAEPIGFSYRASEGSVVNNGHTIQVDLAPGNAIAVRDSTYQLLQFHFHHPAEETVNGQSFAMVAHLVHKNAEGQLAVVAVLLTPGEANPAVDTVWKYMPLDQGDRVKLPAGALNLSDLLPKDQRYYQFMGSLTTPPCTEDVLWMVLKTPVTLSPAQIRLFGQLFPHNARPVQPVNGRPVREAL